MCSAVSLIGFDDLSLQVRLKRARVIPKSGTINKVVIYRSLVFFTCKKSEPSVLESQVVPLLKHKLPMSLT